MTHGIRKGPPGSAVLPWLLGETVQLRGILFGLVLRGFSSRPGDVGPLAAEFVAFKVGKCVEKWNLFKFLPFFLVEGLWIT